MQHWRRCCHVLKSLVCKLSEFMVPSSHTRSSAREDRGHQECFPPNECHRAQIVSQHHHLLQQVPSKHVDIVGTIVHVIAAVLPVGMEQRAGESISRLEGLTRILSATHAFQLGTEGCPGMRCLGVWSRCSARSSDAEQNREAGVAYASRSLSKSKRNYSQLEKEGLACVFGVKRFHAYLFRHLFVLVTDHKPLHSLLSESRASSPQASARIKRWSLFMSTYEYNIRFRGTQWPGNADALSRLPLPNTPPADELPPRVSSTRGPFDEFPSRSTADPPVDRERPFVVVCSTSHPAGLARIMFTRIGGILL